MRQVLEVIKNLGCAHLSSDGQRRLDLLELHRGRVGELVARLDRLHLTRSALRVLLEGGKKIRAAGLLGLLEDASAFWSRQSKTGPKS